MKIRLIRHATLMLEVAGRRLLVDPVLSEAGAMPPIPMTPNGRRNPLVGLPVPVSELLEGVEAVLVTHLHRDHFDPAAADLLPKDLPVICQPGDEERLRAMGFTRAEPASGTLEWGGIAITRTGGRHGSDFVACTMGQVSGFVLRAPGEPVLYLAGDTVWCDPVADALATHQPDVVVLNAGAAQMSMGAPITMTAGDVAQVTATRPSARVVAVHMEAVNHCLLTREGLRRAVPGVIIPADGELLTF